MPKSHWFPRPCASRLLRAQRVVRAEVLLDLHRPFGREEVGGPVDVALEADALFVQLPQRGEGEDLVPAAVGEEGSFPPREPVEAAEPGDERVAGPEHQVVRVREQDPRADLAQVAVQHRLDGARRAHRHEDGGLHLAVRGREPPGAGAAVARLHHEGESGHGGASIDSRP
jgi:hypothetical protein